ncbi:hypothetical protein TSOC_007410 [Tetrabaena socialis]|uniref:Uncharacterized protein n=1 Tax=Tetrabaena socialis TaxID=47790 RepID=A0A2J8A124_9CHLO|nr:hypothetical protein TSOC_007410 [Tetrabaena socialis]|eukprot:PNH06223.1 hypothetical protein TSOC_007410 [Tetrabaena socialis]
MRYSKPGRDQGGGMNSVVIAAAATLSLLVASTWLLWPASRSKPLVVSNATAVTSTAAAQPVQDDGPVSQEAQRLAAVYKKMADEFTNGDLDPAVIGQLRGWFHGLEGKADTPWPRRYTELEEPLRFGAVRLLVVPLDESPAVLRIAAGVTADVMRLLPLGAKVFANSRGNYHSTIFHTSQPTDPRADPTLPDGGVDLSLRPAQRRTMTPAEWGHELETMRRLVSETPVPVLRLERVVQAASGVLLLTWTEVGEGAVIPDLRRRLREAFPGASTKQATIIHSSMLRIAVAAISAAAERWSARLRGTRYSPAALWLIRETEFSTIAGEREVLTLADPAAAPRRW